MTAPTPEKIQRYEIPDYDYGVRKVTRPPREMDLVEYEDHLRHLKLAQIEVLEAVESDFRMNEEDQTFEIDAYEFNSRLAALQKELEG